MENPRFKSEAVGETRSPKKEDVKCKDCIFAEKDRKSGDMVLDGATLGVCEVYPIKPPSILLKGADCPYYVSESE